MKSRSIRLGIALAAAGLCLQPLAANAAGGDWLLRAGVGVVDPKTDNLALSPAADIQVDRGTSLTIEATYLFADHWGVELLAAYPFNHDVNIDDADGSSKVGEVDHLPPTLSLQYHFNPEGRVRPYIGGGLNYTTLFSEKTRGDLAGTDLELDDSWGLAGQVGADFALTDNWFLNLAVRYIDIDSDAKLDGAELGTVEIDPFVYQAQVGYRFGRALPAAAAATPVAAAVAAPPPPPPARPVDSDGDGVADGSDQCPDTPTGDRVGGQGGSAADLTRLKFIAGTVVGHTDSSGSEAYNQRLSERRAETVSVYLQDKGIAVGRLAASGAGEGEPIADNKSNEGRARNRRVVLKRTDCEAPN